MRVSFFQRCHCSVVSPSLSALRRRIIFSGSKRSGQFRWRRKLFVTIHKSRSQLASCTNLVMILWKKEIKSMHVHTCHFEIYTWRIGLNIVWYHLGSWLLNVESNLLRSALCQFSICGILDSCPNAHPDVCSLFKQNGSGFSGVWYPCAADLTPLFA